MLSGWKNKIIIPLVDQSQGLQKAQDVLQEVQWPIGKKNIILHG